ncbi:Abi-alpha family protein [Candidatus Latescibacterota bacterium]
MNEVEEIAKAIQESAKLGKEGLNIAQKSGTFFAKVLKEPSYEISGMITDKLRFLRWKRLVQMADEVNIILEEKGINDTRAVPPKIALPLFEEASLEDDPNLQKLWNHLLANAMNPIFNDEIRYGFIDMIKGITGLEARLLYEFYDTLDKEGNLRPLIDVLHHSINKEIIMQAFGLSVDTYAISINNLMRMQLLAPAIHITESVEIMSHPLTSYKGYDSVTLTPLGVKFVEACIK